MAAAAAAAAAAVAAAAGFPCYACQNNTISVDGGKCTSCLVFNSEASSDHTMCTCKYGYDPVLLGGRLQMCKQWNLNCGAIPNSEVDITGTCEHSALP
jgi:hypothetical protein